MSNADLWLTEYGRDHTHRLNRALHAVCIPLFVTAVVGLLWSLPVPAVLHEVSPVLNWGTFFLMAAVVYYFILSIPLAIGMLPFILLVAVAVAWLERLEVPLWITSASAFALASTGQVLGHLFERRTVSLLSDLNFLMIAPLWLLAALYHRLRIPY